MKKDIEKIRKLIDSGNLTRAAYFLEKFIKKYPNDEWSKGLYVSILLLENRFDEAEICLDSISNSKYDKNYHKYRIAFLKGDYQKAYDLLPEAKISASNLGYEIIFFEAEKLFLESRLGILVKPKYFDRLGYLKKQIIDYDYERTIEHIRHHKNKKELEEFQDLIEDELDIRKLFYLVKESLKTTKNFNYETDKLTKICYFEYPEVSKKILRYGYTFKYLKVVVFKDTNEIVTIYPISTNHKIQNINYLKKEEEKVLVKGPSRIDKFNQKYNKEK